ncbi:MAG: CapA family protein [Patescibacteria group bacterium]
MRSLLAKFGVSSVALAAAFGLASVAEAPYSLIPQERPVSVLFFGDLMLDRGVSTRAVGGAELIAGVVPLAREADLVVLNLEGTITRNESVAVQDHNVLRFTFDPTLTQSVLGALGVDAVSLANNHALDFYAAGHEETRATLTRMGVASFGHPLNSQSISTMLVHDEWRICLVGYHELFDPSIASVVAEVARLKPVCDKVVVVTHWGVEYEAAPSASQVAHAHAFVDAGADLIVGAHPHVVEPVEVYRGRAIVYSLGNFVFDQDFSWETTHGLALSVRFSKNETRLTLLPLAIPRSHPTPALGEEGGRVLQAAGGVDTFILP